MMANSDFPGSSTDSFAASPSALAEAPFPSPTERGLLRTRDWLVPLLVIAGGVAAFGVDKAVADWLAQPISSGQLKGVLRAMRCWGEGYTLVIIMAAIACVDRQHGRRLVAIALATLVAALAVNGAKKLFERPRPEMVRTAAELVPGVPPAAAFGGWNSSFPSGHTGTAFAFARTLSLAYPPVTPVVMVAAATTGLSRMYDERHWLSDCIFGGLVGWYLAWLVYRAVMRNFWWPWRKGVRHL